MVAVIGDQIDKRCDRNARKARDAKRYREILRNRQGRRQDLVKSGELATLDIIVLAEMRTAWHVAPVEDPSYSTLISVNQIRAMSSDHTRIDLPAWYAYDLGLI